MQHTLKYATFYSDAKKENKIDTTKRLAIKGSSF